MSKEFIEGKYGNQHLQKARTQQKQIRYFINSEIQEDISTTYLDEWAKRNFKTDDYFYNWLKVIFKTDNFLSFYKYHRLPSATSGLINQIIMPQLKRVFYSEDSYFRYVINGKEVPPPYEMKCGHFDNEILKAIVFRYNDILVYDKKDGEFPYRDLVSINNVVSIESERGEIHRIAYSGTVDGELGYIYLDESVYAFYDKEYNLIKEIPHELGECPADYLVPDSFDQRDNLFYQDPVRVSLFSNSRELLEQYDFLKTLQRMTEVNGAFPVSVYPKTTDNKKDEENIDEAALNGGNNLNSGYVAKPPSSAVQAGTVVKLPVPKKTDGSYDMDLIDKYFKFFYVPVEILEYINKRVNEVEDNLIKSILGDYSEANESQKNELQVSKSYVSKQDKLRELSSLLTRIRNISDYKLLALEYGRNNVSVDGFYGSDFFLETEDDLYAKFEKSPNTIERKNILVKLSSTRFKFNPTRAKREKILYNLLPFVSDKDFDLAIARGGIDDITFSYQTRFNYWISLFEANYVDIVEYWDSLGDIKDSQKIININNLVQKFIKDYDEKEDNSSPNDSEGGAAQE